MSPYVFRKSAVSMTVASATVASSCVQTSELRLEQPPDLLVGDAARPQLVNRVGHDALARADGVGQFLCASVSSHKRSCSLTQLDDTFVFELAIGLCHRVRVDDELLSERPDAG